MLREAPVDLLATSGSCLSALAIDIRDGGAAGSTDEASASVLAGVQ